MTVVELRKVTMPDRQEIHRRLCTVSDDPKLVLHWYPILEATAGRTKFGPGVILLLQISLARLTPVLPSKSWTFAHDSIAHYAEALIDDPVALEEAKDFWRRVVERMKS